MQDSLCGCQPKNGGLLMTAMVCTYCCVPFSTRTWSIKAEFRGRDPVMINNLTAELPLQRCIAAQFFPAPGSYTATVRLHPPPNAEPRRWHFRWKGPNQEGDQWVLCSQTISGQSNRLYLGCFQVDKVRLKPTPPCPAP